MNEMSPRWRPYLLAEPDGRTRDGRFLRDIRNDLLAQLGDRPSATERRLVEVAARLSLFTARFDARVASGDVLAAEEAAAYAAATAALSATLRDIARPATVSAAAPEAAS
jgi:hypothetical protein